MTAMKAFPTWRLCESIAGDKCAPASNVKAIIKYFYTRPAKDKSRKTVKRHLYHNNTKYDYRTPLKRKSAKQCST